MGYFYNRLIINEFMFLYYQILFYMLHVRRFWLILVDL
nr:MAG TPA: hypothetical protein [Caudoviricetes sp.]